jgi:nicotinamidase/pyrazinamidase
MSIRGVDKSPLADRKPFGPLNELNYEQQPQGGFGMFDIGEGDCLVVVDVQNDFCPGGALGVAEGDQVVPVLNAWIREFHKKGLPVIYTQDWHPQDHCSFAGNGGIWPPHCVQGTKGADFHPDLVVQGEICRKGFVTDAEAYSGFDGRVGGLDGPTLGTWLKQRAVARIFVGGLATDYCVKATVLDGIGNGLEVAVLRDGIRAVNVNEGDGEKAIAEMAGAGAIIR